MAPDNNLQFISKKLDIINNAVMYTLGNSLAQFPNDVVKFLEVDEEGQLWFMAHKPKQGLSTFRHSFPVRLFFYRKGIEYYIETRGTAIIADKEDVRFHKVLDPGSVLLKMIPSVIEYTETGKKQFFPAWAKWWAKIINTIQEKILLHSPKSLPLSGLKKTDL